MRSAITILLFLISFAGIAQSPVGNPTQFNRGWSRWGYLQSDSGSIIAARDTSWTARFAGTQVLWQNAGVDTTFWFYDGAKWKQVGVNSAQASDTVVAKGPIFVVVGDKDTITLRHGYGLDIRASDTALIVDTSQIATIDTVYRLLTRSVVVVDTIEFIHSGSSVSSYQNDKLIDSKLLSLIIQDYPVGFLAQSGNVSLTFDPTTGTITLTNGLFVLDDDVKILYRTNAIFLVDGDGRFVLDSEGRFIIIN